MQAMHASATFSRCVLPLFVMQPNRVTGQWFCDGLVTPTSYMEV